MFLAYITFAGVTKDDAMATITRVQEYCWTIFMKEPGGSKEKDDDPKLFEAYAKTVAAFPEAMQHRYCYPCRANKENYELTELASRHGAEKASITADDAEQQDKGLLDGDNEDEDSLILSSQMAMNNHQLPARPSNKVIMSWAQHCRNKFMPNLSFFFLQIGNKTRTGRSLRKTPKALESEIQSEIQKALEGPTDQRRAVPKLTVGLAKRPGKGQKRSADHENEVPEVTNSLPKQPRKELALSDDGAHLVGVDPNTARRRKKQKQRGKDTGAHGGSDSSCEVLPQETPGDVDDDEEDSRVEDDNDEDMLSDPVDESNKNKKRKRKNKSKDRGPPRKTW